MRAGENVCIQAITPTQRSSAVASRHSRRIASALVKTGFGTTVTGIAADASRLAASSRARASTVAITSSP
jgi:hypothetical protein